jgi:DNA-3-methyladenine glycosylase
VAYDLVGTVLHVVRDGTPVSGRIVETEAYAGPLDLASHSSRSTRALELLSGMPGTLYMYRSYGIHTMLNIVGHDPGLTGGILIRALEPISGVETMQARRGAKSRSLATGPGVLTQSFALRLDDIGLDLIESPEIWLSASDRDVEVSAGTRIGISRGLTADWRFFASDSAYVSVHRRGRRISSIDLDGMIPADGTIIV